MILSAFSLIAFGPTDSFAYFAEKTNLEHYQENEIILIGTVVSLEENTTKGFTEYEINVEKFLKNPQTSNTIFVKSSGVASSDIKLSIDKIFSEQDRVFLLLNEINGLYQVSPHSFNALLFNPDEEFLLPPLTLHRAGISSEDIVCRDNLELVLKASDKTPACVTSNTKAKLVERGWTK